MSANEILYYDVKAKRFVYYGTGQELQAKDYPSIAYKQNKIFEWHIGEFFPSDGCFYEIDLTTFDIVAWQSSIDYDFSIATAPMCRSLQEDIDISQLASGIITVKYNADTITFKNALDGQDSGQRKLWIELKGFNSNGELVFFAKPRLQQLFAEAQIDPEGGTPPEPVIENYYTKSETNALIMTKASMETVGKVQVNSEDAAEYLESKIDNGTIIINDSNKLSVPLQAFLDDITIQLNGDNKLAVRYISASSVYDFQNTVNTNSNLLSAKAKTDLLTVTQYLNLDTITADTALNNSHRYITSGNPHKVTAVEIGRATAQWNANKIKGKEVDDSNVADGKFLQYKASSGKIEYVSMGFIFLTLSADQQTNLSSGNSVKFNIVNGEGIAFDTTTSRVTLAAGKKYLLSASIGTSYASSGNCNLQWYNVSNSSYIGNVGCANINAYVSPTADTIVELRIKNSTNLTAIISESSSAYIQEL